MYDSYQANRYLEAEAVVRKIDALIENMALLAGSVAAELGANSEHLEMEATKDLIKDAVIHTLFCKEYHDALKVMDLGDGDETIEDEARFQWSTSRGCV